MFFDLSFTKLMVLAVLALIIFGPDRLPALAAQAGRALRELRRIADGARSELQESLGPEFSQFDITDLNPRQFVRKHLMDEISADGVLADRSAEAGSGVGTPADPVLTPTLGPGESPPYDAEAT